LEHIERVWESSGKSIVGQVPPEQLAKSLGLVSTLVEAAKDKLAWTFVALASRTPTPSLDYPSPFTGADS
jgi:hypothetical protein